jgi:hypothetical protein
MLVDAPSFASRRPPRPSDRPETRVDCHDGRWIHEILQINPAILRASLAVRYGVFTPYLEALEPARIQALIPLGSC